MIVLSQAGWFAGNLAQYLIPFVFVLTIVVFFHEFGHFIVGRLCGVKVDSFSIGFGPQLVGFVDRHGTRWRIGAIPLGGYVKFYGDLNAASVPDAASVPVAPGEPDVSFFGQVLWKRAAIVAAGPIASFVFAIAVFSATLYAYGMRTAAPRVQEVLAQSAAEAAGFKAGDLVVTVDGQKIDSFADIQNIVSTSGGDPLTIEVERAGSTVRLTATPRVEEVATPFGKHREARLGIKASDAPQDIRVEALNPVQAVGLGTYQTWQILSRTTTFLGRLILGREAADQVSGPIGIAAMSGEMAKLGFTTLLNWAAILSASIGFFNLIPIPLLDGGHLLYFAIEAVRGRPLSLRAQEMGFRIGLAIVALLMIFATSNDLIRIMPKILGLTG